MMTERELNYNAEIAKWAYRTRERWHAYIALFSDSGRVPAGAQDQAVRALYDFKAAQLYLHRLYAERGYQAYIGWVDEDA